MGYIDEDGKYQRFGSSPVSGAYWKMCECELCIMDRTEIISMGEAQEILNHLNEMVQDVMISLKIDSLSL
jgi:hypothetical protein